MIVIIIVTYFWTDLAIFKPIPILKDKTSTSLSPSHFEEGCKFSNNIKIKIIYKNKRKQIPGWKNPIIVRTAKNWEFFQFGIQSLFNNSAIILKLLSRSKYSIYQGFLQNKIFFMISCGDLWNSMFLRKRTRKNWWVSNKQGAWKD